jgi:FkbM family methyltransferase
MNAPSKKMSLFLGLFVLYNSSCYAHDTHIGKYYSQVGQDEYMHKNIFPNKNDGVIIDIGANDGVTLSNSLIFEQLGWQCICIEPLPRAFAELRKNRSCICIQGCVSDKEGIDQFLEIRGGCEMLSGLTSKYDPRHVSRISYEIAQNRASYEVINVRCYKLNFILNAYGITHVDIISLDTEGGELDILKSIDFDRFSIDVICVEDNYGDIELVNYLLERNFIILARLEHDIIFRNKQFCTHAEGV